MHGGWFEPIQAYCERTDAAFWAEPLNAVSNGAFLIAAGAAAWRARAVPEPDRPALALAALVAVVGIGSFLFHTFATYAAMLADVIPIASFIYAYFLLAMRRYFGLSAMVALVLTLAFTGFNAGFTPALEALSGLPVGMFSNGSSDYVPAVLAVLGVGSALLLGGGRSHAAQRRAGWSILGIGALFLVSLTFRTLDTALCPSLSVGTHFVWHLLNAAVLYGLIAVAMQFTKRGGLDLRVLPPTTSG